MDYLGIAEDLQSALADYTHRDQANQELGQDLRAARDPGDASTNTRVVASDPARARLAGDAGRAGGDRAYLDAVAATVKYLLGTAPRPDDPTTRATEDHRA